MGENIYTALDTIACNLADIANSLQEIAKKCPDCSRQPEQKINVMVDNQLITDHSDD